MTKVNCTTCFMLMLNTVHISSNKIDKFKKNMTFLLKCNIQNSRYCYNSIVIIPKYNNDDSVEVKE